MGLFEPGSDRGRCTGVVEYRGVVPEYPIWGNLGILGVGADRGERACQPGLKQRHVCI